MEIKEKGKEMEMGSTARIRYGHLKHDILGSSIKEFSNATGIALPWNLNKVDQWKGVESFDESKDQHPREQVQEIVRSCQRLAGWLRAAAELPAVTRMVSRTQSPNGMGSPYTTIHLWDFVAKNPSPGRLERQLWKVKRRAQQILSAWEGEHHPSWASIANALCVTKKSIGKAAIIVVAEALTNPRDDWDGSYRGIGNYQAARDLLVSIRSARFPVADNSDGVNARREEEPSLQKLGISVYRIRVTEKYGRFSLKWLVRTDGGRTYHTEWGSPEEALRDAIRAWKRQDELAAENADIVGFLNGDELGFCPLIYLQDSYDAGNCRAGTDSWARQQGWGDRDFVPSVWLIKHLHDEKVRRVVVAARERRVGTERIVAAQ